MTKSIEAVLKMAERALSEIYQEVGALDIGDAAVGLLDSLATAMFEIDALQENQKRGFVNKVAGDDGKDGSP